MFLKERQNKIVELIAQTGRVTVTELADQFHVSHDCIRKDLTQLETQGKLQRVYGGAISVDAGLERRVMKRVDVNTAEKQIIAKLAYEQINENDSVFLDVSSTNVALAHLINEGPKHINLVSNMIEILRICAGAPQLSVLGIGGTVSAEVDGFVGTQALEQIRPMRFDKAFLGSLSLTLDTGELGTLDIDDALTKKMILQNSRKSYLLLDVHKIVEDSQDGKGNYVYAHASDFYAVISDVRTVKLKAQVKEIGSVLL